MNVYPNKTLVIEVLFSSEIFLVLGTVVFLFLFGNYCLIID